MIHTGASGSSVRKAVSYTHLDVYKRQSLCCALAGRVGRALRKLRAALSAAELALPLQRRFLRRGLAAAVCILLLSIAAWFLLYLLFYNVLFYYFNFWRQRFFSLLLATALVLLLLAPMVWLCLLYTSRCV